MPFASSRLTEGGASPPGRTPGPKPAGKEIGSVMRITTLGTSHGNPTYCRYNSSTLVETGGNLYLVDAGEPVMSQMIRAQKDFDRLKAVFVTHMHNDHVGGLAGLIKMLIKYPREGNHADVFLPDPSGIPHLEAWVKAQYIEYPSPVVSLQPTRPGSVYRDAAVAVEAQPTRHVLKPAGAPSFAYVVRAEGKVAVFTGDLKADFSDFPPAARDAPSDVCVCEATHFTPREGTTAEAMAVLQRAPIRRLILSHIGDRWHGLDGEDELKRWLRKLPYPASIACDGDVFDV